MSNVVRDIFGQDITDYDVEIVIDSFNRMAVNAADQYQQRYQAAVTRFRRGQLPANRLVRTVYNIAKAAGLASALVSSWNMKNNERDKEHPSRIRESAKRKAEQELPRQGKYQALDMPPKNQIEDEDDVMGEEPVQAMAIGGMLRGAIKETKISPQTPHYGLPDTTTVILPYTQYITVVTNPTYNDNTINFELRLNSPYDCFKTGTNNQTDGGPIGAGRYRVKPGTGTTWPNPAQPYPIQTSADPNQSEAPQWRDYFAKIYDVYSVLGVEYEITYHHPRSGRNSDMAVAYGINSSSNANAGRIFPDARMHDMEYWPDLKWLVVKDQNDGKSDDSYAVIKGYYIPGSAKRNTQNDEDVKTWTKVTELPSLNEELRCHHSPAAFNNATGSIAVMCKIQLKYIVQFKDKKQSIRYPASQSAFAINIPTDIKRLV